MKAKITLILGLTALSAILCGNLSAQTAPTTGQATATAAPATDNNPAANQDILVVSGRIIDKDSKEPIKNAKINFDKFGEEMLHASIDENGNYTLVMNKKELGEPIRLVFKIAGYKRYVIKNISKAVTHLNADMFLESEESASKSSGNVKYVMDESPVSTMVIKMQ